ncbi:MAG TPA: ABC transporter permease [Kofleriaceae bacterium]|nr:ABC transporter permease [Kofleriaceae bacterium]
MSGGAETRDARRPLPAGAVVLELARQALVRVVRGRALWVMAAIALLPTLMAVVAAGTGHLDERSWERVFAPCLFVLVVVPPVLVASAVADEVEDKTAAYLWSRALPRWTVVVGKLVGLAPLCALLVAGSGAVAYLAGNLASVTPTHELVRGLVGLAAGGLAASAIAAMAGIVLPRHAVAVTIGWMLIVDAPLGALDIRLHHLSTTFGALAIAGLNDGTALAGGITLAVLAAVAVSVACWRISRME